MAEETEEVPLLDLESVIGFNGRVISGLAVHPNEEHIIYPLGTTLIQRNIQTSTQEFLQVHSSNVSCVAVSRSGRYVASGQVTFIGFKADVIIWDHADKEIYAKLQLHKVKVEDLAFSPNEKYLVTLGGQDDGSVVVWSVEKREALCGSPAAPHCGLLCLRARFSNLSDDIIVSGGNGTIRVWDLDARARKIHPTECQIGQLRRIVKCIEVSEDDSFFYCGTTSGDILKINLKTKLLNCYGPLKQKFSKGVNDLKMLKTGEILVGSGDGLISLCKESNFKALMTAQLEGGVTSVALQGNLLFAGTEAAQIYRINNDFKAELVSTSHSNPVNGVAFPYGTSELFATCSKNDIRVWHTVTSKELLRITVPNLTCNVVSFLADGSCIISAWCDGQIRGFTPESGKLMFIVAHAHNQGVTAMAAAKDCRTIVTGGGEGQVRIWDVPPGSHRLVEAMKEHKAPVNFIAMKSDDKECVTASADGACIIWDLVSFARKQMFLASTMFKCVSYHPHGFQIITCGTDRKVAYWEMFDGVPVRTLEGSLMGSINGIDVSADGQFFVTGGDEKLVKVWGYISGEVTHVGLSHSGNISSVRICPDSKYVLSTSADGAVLRWRLPRPTTPGRE